MNPFEELGISQNVLKAITELGFTTPTPIQEKSIPVLLEGETDFVGLAQTGTGKTAAFGLPLIELLDLSINQPQGLILCPTRELCLQITKDLQSFSKYHGQINVTAIYGGASITEQLRSIRKGCQIIVATPGRMLDVINRGGVNFTEVRYLILDEADEMLNMGFQEDINSILSNTPKEKKTWLFSATMPNEVRRIASKYMVNPFELTVGEKNTANVNIEHEYYIVRARDKYLALKRIVDFNPDIFGIIFSRTKIETQEIAEALIKDGYNADSLHGDLSQQQRDKVMKRYRDRSLQILVATDVAARGIDVHDITHVINYSLPDEIENYTHRSGRTARAGKTGVSISIINSKELGKIKQLERATNKKFTRCEIPGGYEICEKQLFSIVHKIHNVPVNEEQIAPYMPRILSEFEDTSKEDFIRRFASIEFNRFLDYYKNAPDLNAATENIREGGRFEKGDRADRGSDRSGDRNSRNGSSYARDGDSSGSDRFSRNGSKGDFTRLFINLGSVDDLTRGDLLRLICDSSNLDGSKVGKIDLKGVYSFFEVENDLVNKVFEGFKDIEHSNRKVRVEVSQDGDKRRDERKGGGTYVGGSSSSNFSGKRKSYSSSGDRRTEGNFKGGEGNRSKKSFGDRDKY